MSKPFMQTGISILLRKDISEETGFFDFLTPFTAETWIGVLIAYLGTAACIFIVARLVIFHLWFWLYGFKWECLWMFALLFMLIQTQSM